MAPAFGPNLIAKIAQDPNLRHKLGDEQFMMKLKLLQSNPQQMMSYHVPGPGHVCCHIYWVASRRSARRRAPSSRRSLRWVASMACGAAETPLARPETPPSTRDRASDEMTARTNAGPRS